MGRKSAVEARVEDVLRILEAIGFPLNDFTERRQRRLAEVLLAVAKLGPKDAWSGVAVWQKDGDWCPRSRDIIAFLNKNYGEKIADASYDDIRRKNLEFLIPAGLVVGNPGRPEAAHHDAWRGYAINPAARDLFVLFGRPAWKGAIEKFRKQHKPLSELLERKREQRMMPVQLPEGAAIELSKGVHNEIQKAVVEQFLPRFVPGAQVLYIGDFENKMIFSKPEKLKELQFFEVGPTRLPDIIAYDPKRNWLFLIEAVHSSNPVSKLRHLQLEKLAAKCTVGVVYVSAFKDRRALAKWLPEISWETEVWLAESPDHMIHFNGDRFLGPHKKPGA